MELSKIIKVVNLESGIDIKTNRRFRELIIIRSIYYKIAREKTHCTLSEIGKAVCRDHTTVLHGLKCVEYDLKDEKFYNLYIKCLKTLNIPEIVDAENVMYVDRIVEVEKIVYSCSLPDYIIKHLEQYSEDDLKEVFETRLEPFKRLLDLRTINSYDKHSVD